MGAKKDRDAAKFIAQLNVYRAKKRTQLETADLESLGRCSPGPGASATSLAIAHATFSNRICAVVRVLEREES